MTDLAIQTQQLTKKYADLTAVDAVDLTLPAGSVLSILGPNGAGKTTFVRMLTTLLRPTSGAAFVFGRNVRNEPDAVRSMISLTGQFAALEENLTARENLVLAAALRGYRRAAAKRVAASLVERFDLVEFSDRVVKSVSGGQRRRVDLAASLVVPPRLLVLDEPTTGLDPRSRQVIWSTVRDLVAAGITVLLTTQYLDEADALADQIVLIDHGRTVASGTPAELKQRIGEQRVDVIANNADDFRALSDSLGGSFQVTSVPERRMVSIPAPDAIEDLARITSAVGGTGVPVEEIALRRPTLDDVFLTLTGSAVADSPESDSEPVAARPTDPQPAGR